MTPRTPHAAPEPNTDDPVIPVSPAEEAPPPIAPPADKGTPMGDPPSEEAPAKLGTRWRLTFDLHLEQLVLPGERQQSLAQVFFVGIKAGVQRIEGRLAIGIPFIAVGRHGKLPVGLTRRHRRIVKQGCLGLTQKHQGLLRAQHLQPGAGLGAVFPG